MGKESTIFLPPEINGRGAFPLNTDDLPKDSTPLSPKESILQILTEQQKENPNQPIEVNCAALGRKVGVNSRETARKIIEEIKEENPDLDIIKMRRRINFIQLAKLVDTKSGTLLELLRKRGISLGNEALDNFALSLNPRQPGQRYRKSILPDDLDLEKIKEGVRKRKESSPLTRSACQKNPDLYVPLTKLVRKAGLKAQQNIRVIAPELQEAGWTIFIFSPDKVRKLCYYFARTQQAEEIINYLCENRPKIPRRPRPETRELREGVKKLRTEGIKLTNETIAKILGKTYHQVVGMAHELIQDGEIESRIKRKVKS